MTRASVRSRSVKARLSRSMRSWARRSSRGRLSVLFRLVAMRWRKNGTSAAVAFSRSLAAWSVSRCCSGGSRANAATASVTTLVKTSAASSRGRRPKALRLDHCSRKR